ncbi:exported hypothetical protein [Candidatus Sulfotelmatobacter kueseliae]|uniref:Uncharacterized protein n=1 Tax=Candidatus Sulfotelmatobacter kueseliae TaxID=2042962 RepID=A0A2U3KEL8_9BACT|nr:exported hypothetical protein [Candidatus Sulfotelmatobacter kueseliae]
MKAYLFLAFGALWLTLSVLLRRTGYASFWPKGALDPDTVARVFRVMLPILFFGWIAPTALGLWLLWSKR